jgi:hypothetical protein
VFTAASGSLSDCSSAVPPAPGATNGTCWQVTVPPGHGNGTARHDWRGYLSGGYNVTCMIAREPWRSVRCWSAGGELADPTVLTPPPDLPPSVFIHLGPASGLSISVLDGTLAGWGAKSPSLTSATALSAPNAAGAPFLCVAAADAYACAVSAANGRVVCWGDVPPPVTEAAKDWPAIGKSNDWPTLIYLSLPHSACRLDSRLR